MNMHRLEMIDDFIQLIKLNVKNTTVIDALRMVKPRKPTKKNRKYLAVFCCSFGQFIYCDILLQTLRIINVDFRGGTYTRMRLVLQFAIKLIVNISVCGVDGKCIAISLCGHVFLQPTFSTDFVPYAVHCDFI